MAGIPRPSIYGHPIRLAASLTIALAIFIYVYRRITVKAILIVMSLFGIFASLSRSSWLACGLSFVLMAFAVYRKKLTKKKLFYGAIIVIVLLGFMVSGPVKEMISQIMTRFEEATGGSVSRTQRLGSIAYILNAEFKNFNPLSFMFGHGEDAAARMMLGTVININDFSTTDNEYLLILYNYGFVFIMYVLVGIFKCLKMFLAYYEEHSSTEKCLLFICISQTICSFFYEVTENKSCAFLLMICIGMLIGIAKNKRIVFRNHSFNCDSANEVLRESGVGGTRPTV